MNCIRHKSKNGEYHVILTFIKELKMFSDIEDRRKFRSILVEVTKKMNCKIYAQSIMLNHVHLIIKEGAEKKLASIIISICTRFAKYYNKKKNRSGRLFKRRYKSIPINNEFYFYRLFRYIHRNSVKAGASKTPWDYEWSSARDYKNKNGDFYYPEVVARYEKRFRYHPYTLEEFVDLDTDDFYNFILSIIISNKDEIIPPFTMEEFLDSAIDDKMVLDVMEMSFSDEAAKKIYDIELESIGIKDLKTHTNQLEKRKCIFSLRQVGITLVQIRKFSGYSRTELKKEMFPEL